MFRKIGLFTCLLVILSGVSAFSGVDMKEGLWEITTRMEMQGMTFQMPPQTFRQCITKDNMVPQKQREDQECRMIRQKVKGNTVSWTIKCNTPEGTSEMKGKTTYEGGRFTGEMQMTSSDGMEMVQHLKGHWIGQCK